MDFALLIQSASQFSKQTMTKKAKSFKQIVYSARKDGSIFFDCSFLFAAGDAVVSTSELAWKRPIELCREPHFVMIDSLG